MAISNRQIQISVDSMSLVGFSRRDAVRFEQAFRSELTSLLSFAQSADFATGEREHVAGSVSVGDAETMGRNVAHTVFGGLNSG